MYSAFCPCLNALLKLLNTDSRLSLNNKPFSRGQIYTVPENSCQNLLLMIILFMNQMHDNVWLCTDQRAISPILSNTQIETGVSQLDSTICSSIVYGVVSKPHVKKHLISGNVYNICQDMKHPRTLICAVAILH